MNEVTTKDLKDMSSESSKNDAEEIIVVHVTEDENDRFCLKVLFKEFFIIPFTSDQNSLSSTPSPQLGPKKKTAGLLTNDIKEIRKTVSNKQYPEKERRKTVNYLFK